MKQASPHKLTVTPVRPSGARGSAAVGTDTVDLSLRMLEHLASSRQPMGVTELAALFGSSKATVYRHLQTLVRHGFLRQEPVTMRYEVGIKLFVLGERIRERFDILAVARGEMAVLRDEVDQAVTLSALVQAQVVVLEVLQGRAVVNFATQPGTVLDLHASAHGKVALAFGPAALLEACVGGKLKAWTPHTICTRAALERAVQQVRTRGWAVAPNEVLQGVNGLAAPIFNHAGAYVGAVAAVGSIQHIPAAPSKQQIAAVVGAAGRISQKMGWRK
jgi:DNA-binding IclR family transcriptional regulator